ncbi:MAG: hypothetical protein B6242_13535 [Anaerolineaceae bacterium 4572_78]|nr:MAG: hypothetical protein B6242_13535 [Anaerolineaceae bacterium 4572_78]
MMKLIKWMVDIIAPIRGVLPLFGLGIVFMSLLAQIFDGYWTPLEYLTIHDWLLHVGVIVSIIGLMIADTL